jgi:hypothetical protein
MEADLIELFEIFRTILEQCKAVVIVEDDLNICKKLQTKIGISLTMMKQIDFGDLVVQTFMSDLDVFSTVLESILETFRASSLPSLETFQELRGSMIQAVMKLILSTKEFYLTKVGTYLFYLLLFCSSFICLSSISFSFPFRSDLTF